MSASALDEHCRWLAERASVLGELQTKHCRWRAERAAGDTVLSKYTIDGMLGRGSSGTTYAATDRVDGRRVAIKELAIGRLKSWKQFELFEREARTLRGLSHPGIPDYVDYKEEEGCFFLVQELADGPTLKARVADAQRLTDSEVEAIARQLLSVLQYLAGRRCEPSWSRSMYPSTAKVWQTLNIGKSPRIPNNLIISGAVHGQTRGLCSGVVCQTLPVLRYQVGPFSYQSGLKPPR